MRGFVVIMVMSLALTSCGSDLDSPPKVRWGEETCYRCNMIINDQKFAGAIRLRNGELLKYDDLGCLLEDYNSLRDKVHRVWVHKYKGEGWLDATRAWFVQSKSIFSPMGYGIAAFDDQSDAQKLAKKVRGKVKRFGQLETGKEVKRR